MGFGETLATDAAQELVKALTAGLTTAVKKVPALWQRFGERRQAVITEELEHSEAALRAAGEDLPKVQARQEGSWEARLRDLLSECPTAEAELTHIVREIREQIPDSGSIMQNNTASAPGATAQGAILGSVVNYSGGDAVWPGDRP